MQLDQHPPTQTKPILPYRGYFTIKLRKGTNLVNLPPGTRYREGIVTVESKGMVVANHASVQFSVDGQPFAWAVGYVKEVKDREGNILWQSSAEPKTPSWSRKN